MVYLYMAIPHIHDLKSHCHIWMSFMDINKNTVNISIHSTLMWVWSKIMDQSISIIVFFFLICFPCFFPLKMAINESLPFLFPDRTHLDAHAVEKDIGLGVASSRVNGRDAKTLRKSCRKFRRRIMWVSQCHLHPFAPSPMKPTKDSWDSNQLSDGGLLLLYPH